MKKILVLAAAVLMGTGSVAAQRGEGNRQRMTVEQQVSEMTKQLSLTAEQQKQITALYTDFEKKRKSTSETSREQMREERAKLDKQVSGLLTTEQQKKYEEMKQARRGNRGQGQGQGKSKQ